jgi:hypothetical protein
MTFRGAVIVKGPAESSSGCPVGDIGVEGIAERALHLDEDTTCVRRQLALASVPMFGDA